MKRSLIEHRRGDGLMWTQIVSSCWVRGPVCRFSCLFSSSLRRVQSRKAETELQATNGARNEEERRRLIQKRECKVEKETTEEKQ